MENYGTGLIRNLEKLMKYNQMQSIEDLIKSSFLIGNEVQYRDGSEPIFRIIKLKDNWNDYAFIDEKEKIEIYINDKWLTSLSRVFRIVTHNRKRQNELDMLSSLLGKYDQWDFRLIGGKNYIVYDIETLMATSNLKWTEFQLWYSINSWDNEGHDKCFRYIEKDNLKKYVDYLIGYDGRIIGFNNVWFDNIVICYSLGYWQEEIDILNSKSLDIFYYIWNLTDKRMWLNKISSALIWLDKVLKWWGVEWSTLLKQWLSDGDKKALNKVKEYCKWDVKMTLGVLLYLMEHKEFYIEWKKYIYEENQFVDLANNIKNKSKSITNIKKESNLF